MRRGTIVAGLTVGIIGAGGASAVAASIPITVDITGGTVKAGSLTQSPSTGTGLFTGTIDTTTFAATFPTNNTLPSVTVPSATVGTYTGPITIARKPGAFTGQATAGASGVSLNLSGDIAYTFTAGSNVCTGSSVLPSTGATPTFTGAPIDLATGAYSANGTSPAPTVAPADLASGPFCTALNLQLILPNPISSIASAITGKITIPGLVPLPTAVVVPPATSTPTTPTTPSTPTPVVKAGKLSVSVSKPKTVKRGKSTVTKVVVRNTGAGSAKSVTVKLAASGKGVTPRSTSKTYASIAAGKSRTFSVRLKTKRTSAKRSAVKVTVKGASGLSASKSTTLRLR